MKRPFKSVILQKEHELGSCCVRHTAYVIYAVTRIRTWVVAATTRSTNHYTITALDELLFWQKNKNQGGVKN